jgi:hypothetical protein
LSGKNQYGSDASLACESSLFLWMSRRPILKYLLSRVQLIIEEAIEKQFL